MNIVEEIEHDHKKIRVLYKEGTSSDLSFEAKREIFFDLSMILIAHAKSEEAVLYAPACGNQELKTHAFEGFEEHGLMDLLIQELRSEDNVDRWEAKFGVLCDLLKKHLEEEEKEFLPLLSRYYNEKQLREMANEYREMFDRLLKAQKTMMFEPQPIQKNH